MNVNRERDTQLELRINWGVTCGIACMIIMDESECLFMKITEEVPIDEDIQRVIDEHFWDMVDNEDNK